jgi:predicted nuclease of restriction endonuclease-like (RecB) superfamily
MKKLSSHCSSLIKVVRLSPDFDFVIGHVLLEISNELYCIDFILLEVELKVLVSLSTNQIE